MSQNIYIYHITHINNLPSILRNGGLKPKIQMTGDYVNAAREGIQSHRATKTVMIEPYGTLHDYVPFYFASRSPMLYTLNLSGAVDESGQKNIIHIVSSVEKIEEIGLRYVFTDGHAIMDLSEFYNTRDKLHEIDWEVVNSWSWKNTPQDPDRKRRKQAEFLVFDFLPISGIISIGVINDTIKQQTESIIVENGREISVRVKPEWYY